MISISEGDISMVIDPQRGMTVHSLAYRGQELIHLDLKRRATGGTYGIPILFPTPNRVSGGSYRYGGKRVEAQMHGFVRHERFTDIEVSPSSVSGTLAFDGAHPMFPYHGAFGLSLSIQGDSVRWAFTVTNSGPEAFSYGLALHPFFSKVEGMRVNANFSSVMASDEQMIPDGRVEPVAGTPMDFSSGACVQDIDMDTVFVTDGPLRGFLEYGDFSVAIEGSQDFDHAVVYTSPEKPFFCLEPQTCSIDAHNLAAKGYVEEAGLVEMAPYTKHESFVCMTWKENI